MCADREDGSSVVKRKREGSLPEGRAWIAAAILAAAALGPQAARGAADGLLPRPALGALEAAMQEPPPLPTAPGPGQSVPRHPSLKWALLMSAVYPGTGELYAGHRNRGLMFATAETGIWITYATFSVQEDLRFDHAVDYAVAVAGAVPDGNDDYYTAVAQFLRTDGPGQWNEYVRRKARDGEPVGVEYSGDAAWAWPSVDQFLNYRDLRRRSLEAGDNATNMLAVALVNRIASMLDVVQAMRSDASKREENQLGLRLQLGRTPGEMLARLVVQKRF
jgi:hypothetical protein